MASAAGLMALQCEGAAEYRHRQLALLEQPHQPPEADPAAVFEHALAGEVAALDALAKTVRLREADLGEALAVLHGGLRALLVVHDEIDSEACAARPLGVRRVGTVADQVPVVGRGHA